MLGIDPRDLQGAAEDQITYHTRTRGIPLSEFKAEMNRRLEPEYRSLFNRERGKKVRKTIGDASVEFVTAILGWKIKDYGCSVFIHPILDGKPTGEALAIKELMPFATNEQLFNAVYR